VGDMFRRDKAGRLWLHPTSELVALPGQWVIAESVSADSTGFSGCPPEVFNLVFRPNTKSVFQPEVETRCVSDLRTDAPPHPYVGHVGPNPTNGQPHQDADAATLSADLLAAMLGPALLELDGLLESLLVCRPE